MNNKSECPFCGYKVSFFQAPKIGDQIRCQACETTSIVTGLFPVELDAIYYDDNINVGPSDRKNRNGPRCPLCGEKNLPIKKLKLKNVFECPECECDLEVVGINPVKLILVEDDSFDSDEEYKYEYAYDDNDDDNDDDW